MTKEFIQRDGLEGWVNEDGAWIEPPTQIEVVKEEPLKLNLRQFMLQLLGTPLFDELNTYLKGYPTLVEFTKDGILTQEEVTKLLEHLDLHLGAQIVSQDLYNVIKGALTNEG